MKGLTPNTNQNPETRIALFQRKEGRRTIHNTEWWFVITDVVTVLTDSVDASDYLKKLGKRDPSLGEVFKGGANCPPLGLEFDTAGGRRLLQCWNTEGIFRLIQSIPSPKAEQTTIFWRSSGEQGVTKQFPVLARTVLNLWSISLKRRFWESFPRAQGKSQR